VAVQAVTAEKSVHAMTERLNVLLVVLGGARADHLSCYGYARETTPFLDRVAQEGVRFTNMVTAEPHTLGAHAALLTGLHSVTHGATEETACLVPRHLVLPQYLKAAGYRTAAFCANPLVSPESGFGAGFDAFFTQRHHNRLAARALLYGRRASDRLLRRHDAGGRRTARALNRWLAAGDQPFCALIHFNETQPCFRPPAPYDRMFLPKGVDPARAKAVDQDRDGQLATRAEMSAEDISIVTALYDGELRYVDQRLSEVAKFLQARGVWERTLFIVTAAHGDTLGERGVAGYRLGMPDSLIRVPLIVRCPLRVPQGFVVEEPAHTTDLLPTILRLVDVPEEGDTLQGRALFNGTGVAPGPGATISERFRPNLSALQRRFPDFDTRPFDVRQKAIRTRREKFIWRSDEANELYDLSRDPGEMVNLIDRRPERAEILRRQLFDWLAHVEKFDTEKPVPRLDAALPPLEPGRSGTA
jgi:arylsulfatase A-like enzyme